MEVYDKVRISKNALKRKFPSKDIFANVASRFNKNADYTSYY